MEAFPLNWPFGYKRTESYKRFRSKFITTADKAQNSLRNELRRLGATDLIISTNIPVRKDGGLYADYMNKRMDDPGVAIYFKYKKKDVSMCCDQYLTVWENVYALAKGIEALRGMERWGVSEFIDRAFTGFTALDSGQSIVIENWWDVLDVEQYCSIDAIKLAYREKCKVHHPDKGGNPDMFIKITKAYEMALKSC